MKKKKNWYQLTYFDKIGNKVSILIEAEDELQCRKIFRKRYGMYFIVEIVKTK